MLPGLLMCSSFSNAVTASEQSYCATGGGLLDWSLRPLVYLVHSSGENFKYGFFQGLMASLNWNLSLWKNNTYYLEILLLFQGISQHVSMKCGHVSFPVSSGYVE